MKKTLLAIGLLSAFGFAHAGFASGFDRGMAIANRIAPEPVQVQVQVQQPAPTSGRTWDDPIRRVVAVIPANDNLTVTCRYSDGSVAIVETAVSCPK